MRFFSAKPEEARGCLLADSVTVADRVLPKGKIIGKTESRLLVDAGIDSVEVVQVGVYDLLARPAAEHIGQTIAGQHMVAMPARRGISKLLATCKGLVDYDVNALQSCTDSDSCCVIDLVQPPRAAVARMQICALVGIDAVAVKSSAVKKFAATLGRLSIREFLPQDTALIQIKTAKGDAKQGRLRRDEIRKRLAWHESKVKLSFSCQTKPNHLAAAFDQACGCQLAIVIWPATDKGLPTKLAKAAATARPEFERWQAQSADKRIRIGKLGKTTVAAIADDTDPQIIERLLDLLHTDASVDTVHLD